MHDEQDEAIGRIVGELSALPKVKPFSTERVMARVAAKQAALEQEFGEDAMGAAGFHAGMASAAGARRRTISLRSAGLLAVAATFAGFMIRGAFSRSDGEVSDTRVPGVDTPALSGSTTVPVADVLSRERDEAAVEVQFILSDRRASRVSLVGDFNAWDAKRTPMARQPGSDLWAATLPLTPGRHVYAFVVDDSVWTLDPRAPRATDADYGTGQSVIIVGRP